MKRPVGIVLSAIALGLIALFVLFFALGGIAASLNGPRFADGGGATGLPSPAMFKAVMFMMTLAYLALAAWSVFTLTGLLRMRSWARVSAIVIAACLCVLGVLSALGMVIVASAVATGSFPMPPNVSSDLLHKVLVFMGIASLGVAALSGGWIVYLAQRRTRQAFEEARARRGNTLPYPPDLYPNPQFRAQMGAPPQRLARPQPSFNPLTDFTIARPLVVPENEPVAPPFDPQSIAYPTAQYRATQYPNAPYKAPCWQPQDVPQYTAAAPRSGRPVSITILSVLALIYAVLTIVGIVTPVPGFIFGFVVGGWPFHLYSLVSATATAICGLGMLRLQRPAWLLSFVLLGINSLNFFAFLLPGARARYIHYLAEQQARFGGQQPQLPANIMAISIAIGVVFGLALMVFFALMLWRARWAFEPKATPPADEQTPAA